MGGCFGFGGGFRCFRAGRLGLGHRLGCGGLVVRRGGELIQILNERLVAVRAGVGMGVFLFATDADVAGVGMAVLRQVLLAAHQLGGEVRGVAGVAVGVARRLGQDAGQLALGIAIVPMGMGGMLHLTAGRLGLGIAILGMMVGGLLPQGADQRAVGIIAIIPGVGMGVDLLLAAGQLIAGGGMGMLLKAAAQILLFHGDSGQNQRIGGAEHHKGGNAGDHIAPDISLFSLCGKLIRTAKITHRNPPFPQR